MDIQINKKIGALMILSLLVGGAIGGTIGFVASEHEGYGDRSGYDMNDDHADGETNDDQGGVPNQDEQNPVANTTQTAPVAPTTTATPVQ